MDNTNKPPGNPPDNAKFLFGGIMRIETPDGPVSVIVPVLKRLMEHGVVIEVQEDGKQKYWSDSRDTLHKAAAELGVCDFCSAPDPKHVIPVPDFSMPEGAGQSTGGWAACETCYALVQANKRAELLRRSVERASVGKFGAAAIQTLHESFWTAREEVSDAVGTAAALIDFIENRHPDVPKSGVREERAEFVRRMTGLTDTELESIGSGDMVAFKQAIGKLNKFAKLVDGKKNAQKILELMQAGQRPPMPPGYVPHWQAALDARFKTIALLEHAIKKIATSAVPTEIAAFPDAIDLNDPKAVRDVIGRAREQRDFELVIFQDDMRQLRAAEVYSFNEETTAAIIEASKSIPHDSPLSSIQTPSTGAGWFWFGKLPVVSNTFASDYTAALSWGWSDLEGGEAALRFTAYVVDDKSKDTTHQLLPGTRWSWPVSMSFHEMLAAVAKSHRKHYGPGGVFASRRNMSEEEVLKGVADLSLFFLMACVWFRQKVLVASAGHIERHARKRYVREYKLAEIPTVRVIALRAALRQPVEKVGTAENGEEKKSTRREPDYRWISRGHSRLQVCGPGLKDRKLVWIAAYPNGPKGKPLRIRERVFAVIR